MENKKDKELEHEKVHCGECGCGEEDFEFDEEDDIMYLTLDDDSELECNVLGIFEVEDKEYIALAPLNEDEALIYEYLELGDGDFDLLSIEEEEEFEVVSQAFHALFSDD